MDEQADVTQQFYGLMLEQHMVKLGASINLLETAFESIRNAMSACETGMVNLNHMLAMQHELYESVFAQQEDNDMDEDGVTFTTDMDNGDMV